jgi:hypothetical protein
MCSGQDGSSTRVGTLLTRVMDFVPSGIVSLYGHGLDLCPLDGCGAAYRRCNVSIARQRDAEVI